MKTQTIIFTLLSALLSPLGAASQVRPSMYGEDAAADVKMDYTFSLEEAFSRAREEKKPVFFNCYADWAIPCHSMDKVVFSDREFCDFMNKNFVNLYMDLSLPENSAVAKHYNVISFAQYLVLDSKGDILLRIQGGKDKDWFRSDVSLALNPKTTYPGAKAIYENGKHGKTETLNYLRVLQLAGEDDKFKEINGIYFNTLKPKEYPRKENWISFSSAVTDRKSPAYSYLTAHRADFVKQNGEETVNRFIEGLFYWDVAGSLLGTKPADGIALAVLKADMQEAGLPESSWLYTMHRLASLKADGNVHALLEALYENKEKLGPQMKFYIDSTLDFPNADDAVKKEFAQYLEHSASDFGGNTYGTQLREKAKALLHKPEGIDFLHIGFDEALAKAKAGGRPVFIDCHTSWCGPCKRLAATVFTDPEVAEVFNGNFICLKVDMEKGEGPALAERYDVKVYPTLLFLDGDGNVLLRNQGAPSKEKLLRIAREAAK